MCCDPAHRVPLLADTYAGYHPGASLGDVHATRARLPLFITLTLRMRRAACPQGATYWVRVPAMGVPYVARTMAPQVLGCAFLFAAFVCLLVWVLWLYGAINGERRFWFSNRLHFSNAAQCNTTEFEPAGLVEVDGTPLCTAA